MKIADALKKVVAHIHAQGEPGFHGNGCQYRAAATGYRCAVGHFLPDELIDRMDAAGLSGYGITDIADWSGEHRDESNSELIQEVLDVLALDDDEDMVAFWQEVQDAHDTAAMEGPYDNRQYYTGEEFVERFDQRIQAVFDKYRDLVAGGAS